MPQTRVVWYKWDRVSPNLSDPSPTTAVVASLACNSCMQLVRSIDPNVVRDVESSRGPRAVPN
jgi:hypothetical protein